MHSTVALRERACVSALLTQVLHTIKREHRLPDRRNMRTWRQLLLAILVQRSTRLIRLGQVVMSQRRTRTAKAAAMALTSFLTTSHFPMRPVALHVLEQLLRRLAPQHLVTYRGKVLLVIDPTEYAKRSRGRGKKNRQMQYIGRVRHTTQRRRKRKGKGRGGKEAASPAPVRTTYGYVDIWTGIVLRGKRFLPLARALFSSQHPALRSQNRTEEGVLGQALAVLRRVGLEAIIVGDRGLGRKELIIRLARASYDLVFRIDPDITVIPAAETEGRLLDAHLETRPFLGEATWERGEQDTLSGRVRTARVRLQFSRSGRKGDVQEATVMVVQFVPEDEHLDPLTLVTTLPVETLSQVRAVLRIYSLRWTIETAFETMHAWGQDAFMVRAWRAIDRLLWTLACSYALVVLLLVLRSMHSLRRQATALLKERAVLGRRLTVGKLAEAIGLDYLHHRRAWITAWSP